FARAEIRKIRRSEIWKPRKRSRKGCRRKSRCTRECKKGRRAWKRRCKSRRKKQRNRSLSDQGLARFDFKNHAIHAGRRVTQCKDCRRSLASVTSVAVQESRSPWAFSSTAGFLSMFWHQCFPSTLLDEA